MEYLPEEINIKIKEKMEEEMLIKMSILNEEKFNEYEEYILRENEVNYIRTRHYDINKAIKIKKSINMNNADMEKMNNLVELNINYNENITDEGLKHVPLLQTLYAAGTKITNEGLKHVPLLQTLDARGTKITDEGLKHVPLLQTLDVRETKITNECLKHVPLLIIYNGKNIKK